MYISGVRTENIVIALTSEKLNHFFLNIVQLCISMCERSDEILSSRVQSSQCLKFEQITQTNWDF